MVNGRPFEIVGVAAEGFEGVLLDGDVGAWLPGSAFPWVIRYEDTLDYSQRNAGVYYEFVARAAPGASWEQVRAEMRINNIDTKLDNNMRPHAARTLVNTWPQLDPVIPTKALWS